MPDDTTTAAAAAAALPSPPSPTTPREQLGPLLRLWGLNRAQLPDASATAADLAPFLLSILQEAVPFIDSVAPKSPATAPDAAGGKQLWKQKSTKTFADSAGKVELLERTVATADLEAAAARAGLTSVRPTRPETWVCRRSLHRDAAARGSASWAEFRSCLKDRHAETEDAFTPSVVGAREAMAWDCAGVEGAEAGQRWGDFTLRVEEMRHRVGRPLRDRTFPVLQMTCAVLDDGTAAPAAAAAAEQPAPLPPREFLVVSITIPDFAAAPQAQLSRDKKVVVASYVSVERVRKLPAWDGEIEWIMATASDARGVLPMWVQTMAVPGQIAKDVPLFLAWLARERAGEGHPPDAAAAPADEEAAAKKGKEKKTKKDKSATAAAAAAAAPAVAAANGNNSSTAPPPAPPKAVFDEILVPAKATDAGAAVPSGMSAAPAADAPLPPPPPPPAAADATQQGGNAVVERETIAPAPVSPVSSMPVAVHS